MKLPKLVIPVMSASVGRKKINDEFMTARFPKGTGERIEAVLADKEKKIAFIRTAIEKEIARREKAKKQK